jgi:hypothetical protein
MKTRFFFALLVGLILALSVTPAFAQGRSGDGSVCAGGNTTVESGQSVESLALFGCNGTVKTGGTVRGDVVVFGGNLTTESESTVTGNVAVFGGAANIAGTVNGDVAIAGGSVNLASTAVVNGSVRVAGGSLNRAEGATVRGSVTQENSPRFGTAWSRIFTTPFTTPFNGFQLAGANFLRDLITALALAALGALLVVFFPQPTRRVMETAQRQVGPSLGVGCITLLLAPVLFLLLLITLVGPVLLVLALAAAWIFGWIAVGYLAGEKILEAFKAREIAPVLAVVIGVFILAIVGAVPCLGWLISLLIGTVGIGAVILTRFGTRPYPYTPAWAPVGPMGPLPPTATPGPSMPSTGLVPATPSAPPAPQSEDKPRTENVVPGSDEPQI